MSSRLDRLFVLIETGSSPVTRRVASQQLGEVIKYHPLELDHLLNRIFQLLSNSSWDTRIAASQAVEAVCQNTPQWAPPDHLKVEKLLHIPKTLTFEGFDIHSVILNSAPLMASDTLEYVVPPSLDADTELVKKQVEMINTKLNMGISMENIVSDSDLCSVQSSGLDSNKKTVYEVLNLGNAFTFTTDDTRMRVKRKAKSDLRLEGNSSNDIINDKRIKSEDGTAFESSINYTDVDIEWPFESFCLKLKMNLFSSKWEVRHGAACALREVMKTHGKTAGFSAGLERNDLEINHQSWLEDLSLHLLCVLGLDRFGDFISDQVVAPVRETCAQCLGVVVNLMNEKNVMKVVDLFKCLLREKDWEIRHGTLLGVKYSLAVREDLQESILTEVFPLIFDCFRDPIDDVSAEAASALNPVCSKIVRLMPQSIPDLIDQLWKLLSSQDELGVACNCFMSLLASLFMNSEAQSSVSSGMVINIIPFLWSYLYHNASSVRKSTLQTICSLTNSKDCMSRWTHNVLVSTMRHLYQRVLLEPTNEIRILAEEAWCNIANNADLSVLKSISSQFIGLWLCLAMQSPKFPFDETFFIFERNKQLPVNEFEKAENSELKLFLGGNETVPVETRESNVVFIRCMTCRMLGYLLDKVAEPDSIENGENENFSIGYYCSVLSSHLNSKSALQRLIAALVITEWVKLQSNTAQLIPPYVKERLQQYLLETIYFDEIALHYTKILQDTRDYIAILKKHSVTIEDDYNNKVLRLNEIETLTSEKEFQNVLKIKMDTKILMDLQERRQNINSVVCQTANEQNVLTTMTQAVIAGTVLTLKCLPNKWNPIIKPLMDSIRKEESEYLQKLAAAHLARLVELCVGRVPCPNPKIISNLCTFLCVDPEFTPRIVSSKLKNECSLNNVRDKFNGILTLSNQQKIPERTILRRANSNSGNKAAGRSNVTEFNYDSLNSPDQVSKTNKIQRQGASHSLIEITKLLGKNLNVNLSTLWDYIYTDIKNAKIESSESSEADSVADKLVCNLQVFEVLCPYIDKSLLSFIAELLDTLCLILDHSYCAVRHMAARCIAILAKRELVLVVQKLPTLILPFVNAADSVTKRQGGVEAVAALVETLQLDIIPYIVLLIIPLLGRMSDQDDDVRSMASLTFGMLIQLMPLDTASSVPVGLSEELHQTVEEQRTFLNQLLNPKCIPDYKLSVNINASLRSYQQCGVNWLAFLNKYQLHGILCDDMGLGKTLQSLCILADDHYRRDIQYKSNKRADSVPLPSLVVCPPTLIGHWVYEIKKFIPQKYLKTLQYEGIPIERERLRNTALQYNLIVVSYDIVRKDSDFFATKKWNYCILDEGHIIKNGKTKISKAIRQLKANHRIILSGTPIQNNVLELWSLFDFLMPGYLGNEKQFNAKYSKPILASRDPKSSFKEQEAGIMAMETLHQKVLPFILRRMKTDVLKDLPPKITQDYYCDLSSIQQMLYEDFSKSEIQKNTLDAIKSSKSCNTFSMFQALRYLQSVCNHPKLVLTPDHPLYQVITRKLEKDNSSLDDIKHAAKLMALKQLLLDCGIGGSLEGDDVIKSNCIVSQHRALIFCQLKTTLDIIENDLFKVHLPNITYLRLDGKVGANERHKIITAFNEDPSIDVLLLTTHVGGLGLNLTGADTVIFVEHDWSPMKDLQAMDRAHRIGQKKVVNVYRLITRATLEQKIMGLQEFKLKTANTIITAENSSLVTMSTEKLLDLFSLNNNDKRDVIEVDSSKNTNSSTEFMKSLPELWDARDYEEEYDLSNFISSLR